MDELTRASMLMEGICGSIDKEVTPETSETTETPELPESSIIENVESDLEDNESCDDEYETSSVFQGCLDFKYNPKSLLF